MAIPFFCCYHPETDQVIEERNLDAFTPFIIKAKGENVLLCMTSSLYSKILSAPPERNDLCYYYFFIWFSVVDADTISKAAILGIALGALVILLMILVAACRPHNPAPFSDVSLDKPGILSFFYHSMQTMFDDF
jgi:hypothetical protein